MNKNFSHISRRISLETRVFILAPAKAARKRSARGLSRPSSSPKISLGSIPV